MNPSQLNLFGAQSPTKPKTKVNLSSCQIIYTPKGRAREYSALACNIYSGCGHRCIYCYAPDALRKTRDEFDIPSTRGATFLQRLQNEADKYEAAAVSGRVLLCFTCDPYQPLDVEQKVTRSAIRILHDHGLDVQVLTKGGTRALRDLDLFVPKDAFASTLTLLDDQASLKWEPGAALPGDRIAALQAFHEAGIPTWVSLEPVLDPSVALDIIRRTHSFVDLFKVGKINYHPLSNSIDWRSFARRAIALLKSLGYTEIQADDDLQPGERGYYVKRDLRTFL